MSRLIKLKISSDSRLKKILLHNFLHLKMKYLLPVFLILIFVFYGCGNGETEDALTEFELAHGIGPITEKLELGELDLEKAERGQQIFQSICVACHNLDATISGPRLRNVADRREPEFILNYILNPREMSQNHPVGQELSQSYPGNKTELGLNRDEALEVLEFLRAASKREM